MRRKGDTHDPHISQQQTGLPTRSKAEWLSLQTSAEGLSDVSTAGAVTCNRRGHKSDEEVAFLNPAVIQLLCDLRYKRYSRDRETAPCFGQLLCHL